MPTISSLFEQRSCRQALNEFGIWVEFQLLDVPRNDRRQDHPPQPFAKRVVLASPRPLLTWSAPSESLNLRLCVSNSLRLLAQREQLLSWNDQKPKASKPATRLPITPLLPQRTRRFPVGLRVDGRTRRRQFSAVFLQLFDGFEVERHVVIHHQNESRTDLERFSQAIREREIASKCRVRDSVNRAVGDSARFQTSQRFGFEPLVRRANGDGFGHESKTLMTHAVTVSNKSGEPIDRPVPVNNSLTSRITKFNDWLYSLRRKWIYPFRQPKKPSPKRGFYRVTVEKLPHRSNGHSTESGREI